MARVILVALWAAVVLQCVRSQCVGVAGEGCIDCFKNPKTRGCEDTSQWLVQWPESLMKADLAKLCKAMPHMSGCSVEKACKASRNRPEAQFCTEWSLLSNICSPKQGELSAARVYRRWPARAFRVRFDGDHCSILNRSISLTPSE